MSRKKRSVLVIAPGCDGNDVGESWSCHQWVAGLASRFEVTLLTLCRRGQIPASEQLPDVRVIEWPDMRLPKSLERFASLAKPGYPKFYVHARRWIKKQISNGDGYELVHQLGPLALRYPSPAVGCGIPLVVGPLAGSLNTPKGFRNECNHNSSWYVQARRLDRTRLKWDMLLRKTYSSAQVVIGVAPYVARLLESMQVKRFVVESETGVHNCGATARSSTKPGALKLLYVGRLVRHKGLRDLIRAMAFLSDMPQISLNVAGVGEEEAVCRRESKLLGLESRIRFLGRVSRDEVEQLYATSDLFVFPSFREPSGNVVFESLRQGLPVLTTELGGPGYVVDETCGIRLPVETPAQLALGLSKEIRRLADSPEDLTRLSQGALTRASTLGDWTKKIDRMAGLYEEVMQFEPTDATLERRQN